VPRTVHVALAVLVLGAGIVLAGAPARGIVVASSAEILGRLPTQVDPGTLPAVTVGQDVTDFDPTLAGPGMNAIVVTLAQNLELENAALVRRDGSILTADDHGDRLLEMQQRLQSLPASGATTVAHYRFDAIHATLLIPFGKQDGFSIGLQAKGSVVHQPVDAAGVLIGDATVSPFDLTFAVRRATGDRWLTVAVLPAPPG